MHRLFIRSGKLFIAISAAWAIGASVYIFTAPVSSHGVSEFIFRDSGTVMETFTREQSWHESQGLWGTSWLILFSVIYLLALRAGWRGNTKALAIMSVTVLVLSVATGFSIGTIYLPAAFGLVLGTLFFFSSGLLKKR